MSHSFSTSNDIKACRKKHWCHWCGEPIEKGHPAVRIVGVWEGDFGSSHWHPECITVYRSMGYKEREDNGVNEGFEPGTFHRASREER